MLNIADGVQICFMMVRFTDPKSKHLCKNFYEIGKSIKLEGCLKQ